MISLQSVYQIRIKTDKFFFEDSDLIFHSIYSEIYNHIVNTNIIFVYVQNDESINMIILQHIHLDNIAEYKKENCYAVSIENIDLVMYKSLIRLIIQIFKTQLANNIMIYNNKLNKVVTLKTVIKIYSDL